MGLRLVTPTTFAEYMALFFGRALVAAGVAIGLALVALVALMAFGGWPVTLYPAIIEAFAKALIGGGVVLVIVIIFLGLGGPVRRLKAGIGKLSIETEGD